MSMIEKAAEAVMSVEREKGDAFDIGTVAARKIVRAVLTAVRDLDSDRDAHALITGRAELPDEFGGAATIDDFASAFAAAIDAILGETE